MKVRLFGLTLCIGLGLVYLPEMFVIVEYLDRRYVHLAVYFLSFVVVVQSFTKTVCVRGTGRVVDEDL